MADDFFTRDYFSLFGVSRHFVIDENQLAENYRELQKKTHPDRFAAQSEVERRLALTMASRVNDAYATLKNPLTRAAYILSLQGIEPFAETNTDMPQDFLAQQLEWREALMEADGDESAVARLREDVQAARTETVRAVQNALSGEDWPTATAQVRCWRYLDKLLGEI